ncbi:hypothetical protein PUNSTDRAFT_132082 [Punctularia strigosozonata HHB-11173 SS5]|uniref:uncharacterized protein n=1 Tax=Punctularia strigosozonata (strain HHB-11173) TaxID=741275 RepID=UPI000441633D|nr:uncharacterized protein PUNSTDRAFT_132082 [Punctularia strigosozonata HHB-11173 SS5]EIN11937.1 hypothetical protein PUNSTDRAFT_132082 [Punctularia strigosozonata HHB-11173 SS5]
MENLILEQAPPPSPRKKIRKGEKRPLEYCRNGCTTQPKSGSQPKRAEHNCVGLFCKPCCLADFNKCVALGTARQMCPPHNHAAITARTAPLIPVPAVSEDVFAPDPEQLSMLSNLLQSLSRPSPTKPAHDVLPGSPQAPASVAEPSSPFAPLALATPSPSPAPAPTPTPSTSGGFPCTPSARAPILKAISSTWTESRLPVIAETENTVRHKQVRKEVDSRVRKRIVVVVWYKDGEPPRRIDIDLSRTWPNLVLEHHADIIDMFQLMCSTWIDVYYPDEAEWRSIKITAAVPVHQGDNTATPRVLLRIKPDALRSLENCPDLDQELARQPYRRASKRPSGSEAANSIAKKVRVESDHLLLPMDTSHITLPTAIASKIAPASVPSSDVMPTAPANPSIPAPTEAALPLRHWPSEYHVCEIALGLQTYDYLMDLKPDDIENQQAAYHAAWSDATPLKRTTFHDNRKLWIYSPEELRTRFLAYGNSDAGLWRVFQKAYNKEYGSAKPTGMTMPSKQVHRHQGVSKHGRTSAFASHTIPKTQPFPVLERLDPPRVIPIIHGLDDDEHEKEAEKPDLIDHDSVMKFADRCPWCDTDLDFIPSADFLKIYKELLKVSWSEPSSENKYHHATFDLKRQLAFCSQHHFESDVLLARHLGWPQIIDFARLHKRIRRLYDAIRSHATSPMNEFLIAAIARSAGTVGATNTTQRSLSSLSKTSVGYYGEKGLLIILAVLKYSLFPISSPAIDLVAINPLSYSLFLHEVLVPETATQLIMQDLPQLDREGAIQTLHRSRTYGDRMFGDSADDDEVAHVYAEMNALRAKEAADFTLDPNQEVGESFGDWLDKHESRDDCLSIPRDLETATGVEGNDVQGDQVSTRVKREEVSIELGSSSGSGYRTEIANGIEILVIDED